MHVGAKRKSRFSGTSEGISAHLVTGLPCLILNWIGYDRPAPAQRDNLQRIEVGIGGQVKKILKHLGMWAIKARPPPKRANGPPLNIHIDSSARPGATRLPIIGLDYVLF